jgi:hypothetical protein
VVQRPGDDGPPAVPRALPAAPGGPGSAPPRRGPKLAFVIVVQNSPKAAAQCLLEVFRTAGEAASAEIVVVDDGSSADMGLVRRAAERLHAFFGTAVSYVANRGAAGFGGAAMQVASRTAPHGARRVWGM